MTEPASGRAWYLQPEMIIGLSALMVSLVAVFVGVYSTYIDRAFARASVWPRLEVFRSFNTEPRFFKYLVNNTGTGPAVIHYAAVTLDGKPVATWQELVTGLHGAKSVFSQSHIGTRTLVAESTVDVFLTDQPELVSTFLESESSRVGVELCYCSIFDECWRVDRGNDPEPVKRCTISDADRFEQ